MIWRVLAFLLAISLIVLMVLYVATKNKNYLELVKKITRYTIREIESGADHDAEAVLPPVSSGADEKIAALGPSDAEIEKELLKEASLVDQGNRKVAAIKKKIIEKAKKDPEMVSQLLRSVLREGM